LKYFDIAGQIEAIELVVDGNIITKIAIKLALLVLCSVTTV